MLTLLLRILRTTGQSVIRHSMMHLTATLIIALLFVLVNALVFVSLAKQTAMETIQQQLDLAVAFTKPVEEFQVATMSNELKTAFPDLRGTRYVSPDDAFASFITDFESVNADLSDWLASNTAKSPLPATFIISADPTLHRPIVDWLTQSRYATWLDLTTLTQQNLSRTTTTKIIALDRALTQIGWLAGGGFAFLAALIIAAVVRLAITSRSSEIAIMRLVGATQSYIRLPFLLEGIAFAVLASLIGSGIFFFALIQLDPTTLATGIFGVIGELLIAAMQLYAGQLPLIIGWQILAAIILGGLASYLATWRYLTRGVLEN